MTPRSTLQLAIILGVGGYFAHLAWSLWRRALDGTLEGREGWYELATVMSTSRGAGYGAGDFEEIDLSRGAGGGGCKWRRWCWGDYGWGRERWRRRRETAPKQMTSAAIATSLETKIGSDHGAAMFGPGNHFHLIYFCT